MKKYFKDSKYINIYFNIVYRSKDRKKLSKDDKKYIYYEAHHILPKSLFQEYSKLSEYKWNKALLTPREHFICHILLMKHYKFLNDNNGYKKMSMALRRMSTSANYNSRIYSFLRLNLQAWNKGLKGVSEETSKKMSQAKKNYIPWNKGIKTGQKVWNKGKKMDKESPLKGKIIGPMSEETKKKISETKKLKYKNKVHHSKGKEAWNKGKKMETIICPHCKKEGDKGNMKRWHFDNCKLK